MSEITIFSLDSFVQNYAAASARGRPIYTLCLVARGMHRPTSRTRTFVHVCLSPATMHHNPMLAINETLFVVRTDLALHARVTRQWYSVSINKVRQVHKRLLLLSA